MAEAEPQFVFDGDLDAALRKAKRRVWFGKFMVISAILAIGTFGEIVHRGLGFFSLGACLWQFGFVFTGQWLKERRGIEICVGAVHAQSRAEVDPTETPEEDPGGNYV